MRVVIDIETNSLVNPTHIWCVVCKDIDINEYHIFRNITEDENERRNFIEFTLGIRLWIGHNILQFDYPVLSRLLGLPQLDVSNQCVDTLVVSKLVDYSREGGHSVEQYGHEFGLPKIEFNNFKTWSKELEEYCHRDVDITHRIFSKYTDVLSDIRWRPS